VVGTLLLRDRVAQTLFATKKDADDKDEAKKNKRGGGGRDHRFHSSTGWISKKRAALIAKSLASKRVSPKGLASGLRGWPDIY
jgi:hypothetical protein